MSVVEEPRDPLHKSPSDSARPRLKVVRIEFIGVTGAAGDELDDRQNGAIKEILLWLHQQEHTPET